MLQKLREAVLAVKLEQKYSKPEILERYLNTVYFGRGAYGIEAAAKAYFDMDVGQLGLRESAYLAGIIRSPALSDVAPIPNWPPTLRSIVLRALVRDRKVTPQQMAEVEAVAPAVLCQAAHGRRPTPTSPPQGSRVSSTTSSTCARSC